MKRQYSHTYNRCMRIGIGQLNPTVGAIARNCDRILTIVDEARTLACDLVVFPELAVCGCSPRDSVWQPGYVAACGQAIEAIRAASESIGIIVGTVTADDARRSIDRCGGAAPADSARPKLFNAAVLIEDRQIIGTAPKIHLSSHRERDEHRYYTAGPGTELFSCRDVALGISLGEDLWAPDGPADLQASLGANWIINPSASPFHLGKQADLHRSICRRAKETGVSIVHANLVGGQDGLVFDGGSFIVDEEGQILFQAPLFAEGLFVADLPEKQSALLDRNDELEQLHAALTLGIRDYLSKNGFESALIGLSGGIDSAVVAALAADALGPEYVTAVFLPSQFSSKMSRDDARETARRLSIELLEIPITAVHEAMRAALPDQPIGLVDENLQPRIRATLWMALAAQRNALVLCAGNKSEIAMGYSTLYGDTTGALAPIGDLYKTDVFRLARSLGGRIPPRVLDRPPTAELRPEQRDDEDLPPYGVLDALLEKRIEQNQSRAELLAEGFDPPLVDRVLNTLRLTEYKRYQLPPALKVSRQPFGIGRRMPITNAYEV